MSNESSEEKNREMAKTIANILARLIKITLVFEGSYASFETLCGFEKENHLKSMQSLQKIWSQGEDVFIKYCEEKMFSLNRNSYQTNLEFSVSRERKVDAGLSELAVTERLRASENTAPKPQYSKNVQSWHRIFHLVFGVNINSLPYSLRKILCRVNPLSLKIGHPQILLSHKQ